MIQSLVHRRTVNGYGYGHVVVDECHQVSAVSFEAVVRRVKARYIPGFSATVTHGAGRHPIIFMQDGPVRFGPGQIRVRFQACSRSFVHRVVLHKTSFRIQTEYDSDALARKMHEQGGWNLRYVI